MQTTPQIPDDIWRLLVNSLSNRKHMQLRLCCRASSSAITPFVGRLCINSDVASHFPSINSKLTRMHEDVPMNLGTFVFPVSFPKELYIFKDIHTLILDYFDIRGTKYHVFTDGDYTWTEFSMLKDAFQLVLLDLHKLEHLACSVDFISLNDSQEDVVLPTLTSFRALNSHDIPTPLERPIRMPRLRSIEVDGAASVDLLHWFFEGSPKVTSAKGCLLYTEESDLPLSTFTRQLHNLEIFTHVGNPWNPTDAKTVCMISDLCQLKELHLHTIDKYLHPVGIEHLAKLSSLRSLEITALPSGRATLEDGIVHVRPDNKFPTNLTSIDARAGSVVLLYNAVCVALASSETLTKLGFSYRLMGNEKFMIDKLFTAGKQFTKLKRLSLYNVHATVSSQVTVEQVFPCLEEICIESSGCSTIDRMGQLLNLPTLRVLELRNIKTRCVLTPLNGLFNAKWRSSLTKLTLETNLDRSNPRMDMKTRPNFLLAEQLFSSLQYMKIETDSLIDCAELCAILHAAPVLRELCIIGDVTANTDHEISFLGLLLTHKEINLAVLIDKDMKTKYYPNETFVHNHPRTLFIGGIRLPMINKFFEPHNTNLRTSPGDICNPATYQFPYIPRSDDEVYTYFYPKAELMFPTGRGLTGLVRGLDIYEKAILMANNGRKFLTFDRLKEYFNSMFP